MLRGRFKFGDRSLKNLRSCDIRLQSIASKALDISPYDFSIIEGHRSLERQMEMFEQGKSQIDGVNQKGKHNYSPSLAFDFVPYPGQVNGVNVWEDTQRFAVIAGIILSVSIRQGVSLRWGGDWDGDGNNADSGLHDLPHIEIT